jgi:hypothetical protein
MVDKQTTDKKFLGDIMDLNDEHHLNAYIHFIQRGFLPTDYVKWIENEGILKNHPQNGITWYRYIEIKLWGERIAQIYFEKTGKHLSEVNICV